MSTRSEAVRHAIEVSEQGVAPTKPQSLRKKPDDELPREERRALEELVRWPGSVAKCPLGFQLAEAEMLAVYREKCPACIDGWVIPEGKEGKEYARVLDEAGKAWAEQEFAQRRALAISQGRVLDEEVERESCLRWGKREALNFDEENPPAGRRKCGLCEGSGFRIDRRVPAERANKDCSVCKGTGREGYIGFAVEALSDGTVRGVNRPMTRQCRCCDVTAQPTGSSVAVTGAIRSGDGIQRTGKHDGVGGTWDLSTGSALEGASSISSGGTDISVEIDEIELAKQGKRSRRMYRLGRVSSVPKNVADAISPVIKSPGTVLQMALEGWYSPQRPKKVGLEALWPLTRSCEVVLAGLGQDMRHWRAEVKIRRGGEKLIKDADKQAEVILGAAREEWMKTRFPEEPNDWRDELKALMKGCSR